MNATLALALLRDSLYQVLDNRVFRILVGCATLLILIPWILAAREEGVILLFGFRSWSWDTVTDAFSMPAQISSLSGEDLQQMMVGSLQSGLINGLGGTVGIFLSIVATAFFMPRMLEKGAADTLFSKPLARFVFLISNYFTAILFVFLLSFYLVVGMHLGFLVHSGYSDPAFLWSALTLTYAFSLVYGVALLIGVMTRSSVASMLLTVFFYLGNGCVHQIWWVKEMATAEDSVLTLEGEDGDEEDEVEEGEDGDEPEEDETGVIGRVLLGVLDGLHYTLPKTTDAQQIVEEFRSFVPIGEAPDTVLFEDEVTEFTIEELPEGFEVIEATLPDDRISTPVAEDELLLVAGIDGNFDTAWLSLHRRERREIPTGREDRTRTESHSTARRDFEEWLEADDSRTLNDLTSQAVAGRTAWRIEWTQRVNGETLPRFTTIVWVDDWLLTLQLTCTEDWKSENPGEFYSLGARDMRVGPAKDNAREINAEERWIREKVSWTGEWKYNLWFSIGSSLAFVLVMVALSWWRLNRMDF